MHHYHKLRELLATHPVGAPPSDAYLEILKILFRPEEVELVLKLTFKLQPLGEIARAASLDPREAERMLEAMADRGVILAKRLGKESAYALLPNYPGLFEYPVMKGFPPEVQERLAELWHAYYMEAMAAELAAAKPPWSRVLPAEEALPKEAEFEILPFEVASQMMAKAEAISVAKCPCRTLTQRCSRPLEVCLAFDGAARFLAERGMARLITLAEAQEVLRKAEEAALVHTASNNASQLLFICNCCPCCCHFLRLVTEHGYQHALARASFRAEADASLCTGCRICAEERCPVGAISVAEEARVDAARCLGCGLCVSTCPTGALRLTRREGYAPPPANPAALLAEVARNKGRGV